jgi:hypothetical protein
MWHVISSYWSKETCKAKGVELHFRRMSVVNFKCVHMSQFLNYLVLHFLRTCNQLPSLPATVTASLTTERRWLLHISRLSLSPRITSASTPNPTLSAVLHPELCLTGQGEEDIFNFERRIIVGKEMNFMQLKKGNTWSIQGEEGRLETIRIHWQVEGLISAALRKYFFSGGIAVWTGWTTTHILMDVIYNIEIHKY